MRTAKTGYIFVLTEKGYRCTPDTVKLDRQAGESVRGYERRVPVEWLKKGYVIEVIGW